jgi:RHS repeat-associated protein
LTGEYDASGQLIQEILWLGDLPVAVLKPTTSTNSTADLYYLHADHLGTPRKITRPNDNQVVWTWESEAFGNSLPEQDPSGLGNFVFNLRFPGQYYDQETGLHYNMARYYNPRTGRYDESDPIGLRAGINTYGYVEGNPVNLSDPSGECPWCIALIVLDALNILESINDVVDTAKVLGDQCASSNDKLGAVGLFALGIIDPTPGNIGKKVIPSIKEQELKTIFQNPRNLIPTQTKSEMSGSQIKRIAKDMEQNGYHGDPVDVSVNPTTGRLEIQDGHHRTAAAIKAGVTQIPVRVTK